MNDDPNTYAELISVLKERGHSDDEIGKILNYVRQYETKTQIDSAMDSVAAGRFNLDTVIEAALRGQ